ncbi:MAG: enoyl-CoA hydratase/isomerase family protein [Gemmatimonadaceae bacterium]|nr:enoyl-CoA hydratase/isomerase family protein [Gemmatimonadaceae bacterium]
MSTTAPDAGHVSLDVADSIGTITFGHPRGNSLPGQLLRKLAATIEEAGHRHDVQVVRLQSSGTGPFCAGASFDELQAIATPDQGQVFFSGFASVILAMRACPRFVVTRVHGKAAGGAVGLIAASDYCIAHESASVRLSELAIGIGPFVVGPPIAHRIGLAHYTALTVDHDWRDAAWAHRVGLYARTCDTIPALDDAVTSLVRRLARCHPAAMARLKQVFWEGTDHWPELLEERAAMSGALVLSEFTRDAIAAFGTR